MGGRNEKRGRRETLLGKMLVASMLRRGQLHSTQEAFIVHIYTVR